MLPGNTPALFKVLEIASHRGLSADEIMKMAIVQYKTRETQKLNRAYRIFEYNFKKQMQKEMRKQ